MLASSNSTALQSPRIGVTLGDPAGIGPEVMTSVLSNSKLYENAEVILYGSAAEVAQLGNPAIQAHLSTTPQMGKIFIQEAVTPFVQVERGQASAEAGRWAKHQLEAAIGDAKAGRLHGVIYAPLNKYSLQLAGVTVEDDLRWFAELLNFTGTLSEINIGEKIWTARVTSHIPLREVSAHITPAAVHDVVHLLDQLLKVNLNTDQPHLVLCALNPHAGENGKFGDEEIRILQPAVQHLRNEGINIEGPLPSDTAFLYALREGAHGVVTMFHDQGQIAMKMMSDLTGVTLAGGLPIPIATAAHGTAFDLVGKGVARTDSMEMAFTLACKQAEAKFRRDHDIA